MKSSLKSTAIILGALTALYLVIAAVIGLWPFNESGPIEQLVAHEALKDIALFAALLGALGVISVEIMSHLPLEPRESAQAFPHQNPDTLNQ